MPLPSAEVILAAWEEAAPQSLPVRALYYWRLTDDRDLEVLADEPLGVRNRNLWALRQHLFGDNLEVVVRCPSCATLTELNLQISELPLPLPAQTQVSILGQFKLRAVSSRDLLAALAEESPQVLFERCVEPEGPLSPELKAQAEAALQTLDPGANLELYLSCAQCGQPSRHTCDPSDLLSRELHTWAQTRLHEVHLLAQAYGWTEREILHLSPARRRYYLSQVEGV